MNRKKTIDFTVTRRPRDRNSYNTSSAKSRPDSSGRDDGGRDNTPFWSKDIKNLVSLLKPCDLFIIRNGNSLKASSYCNDT